MIKQLVLVFVSSFFFGWIAIELAAWIAGFEFFISRGVVVGIVYAIPWVFVYSLIRKNGWYFAVFIGLAMPIVACLISVVGVGFVSRVIYFWYVFMPIGGLNGLFVYTAIVKLVERDTCQITGNQSE